MIVRRNIVSILIALVILFLSLADSDSINKINIIDLAFADKIVHALIYSVLTISIILENRKHISGVKSWLLIILIPAIFGSVIEVLQSVLPGNREGDVIDACFNVLGILFSVLLWYIFRKKSRSVLR